MKNIIEEEFNPNDYAEPVVTKDTFNPIPDIRFRPDTNFMQTIKIFLPMVGGIVLIVFGLTTTGSYYTTAGRFGGVLAEIWYGWQLGNLLAMIGVVAIYDAIKRSGYL